MSVSPKDKKQLQANWDKAESGSNVDIPDGTYQVKVMSARFHETSNGKYQMKIKYKIVGGDDDYNGKEFELSENLETPQNMGFFKEKLKRLNVAPPQDFDEVMDGTISDQLKGKVFEGQVKTKNNFLNVYVNRLVSEGKADEEDATDGKEEKTTDLEEGAKVEWNGKKGEVVEVLADDNQARVKKEDGSIVRVALNLLSLAEESEDEEDDEDEDEADDKGSKSKKGKKDEDEEDEEESGEFEIPEPEAVEDMSAKEVKSALEELGFDAADLKNARLVLHAFCTLAHDEKAKIQLEEIAPLAAALDVELGKKDDFKTKMKVLSEAVQEKIG